MSHGIGMLPTTVRKYQFNRHPKKDKKKAGAKEKTRPLTLSKPDIEAIMVWALETPYDQLSDVARAQAATTMEVVMAELLTASGAAVKAKFFESMLDRLYGKPANTLNVVDQKPKELIDISSLTIDPVEASNAYKQMMS